MALLYNVLMLVIGLLAGGAAGAGIAHLRARRTAGAAHTHRARLLDNLVALGDALQEVSPGALGKRGGWDRPLFDAVLRQVEAHTPAFQAALAAYLSTPGPHDRETIAALLAVDRLSAAYTYWTRLFPPRQTDTAMFVLSLLHDLGDKVEAAIHLLAD